MKPITWVSAGSPSSVMVAAACFVKAGKPERGIVK
jgi:hypothetical protein